MLNRGKTDMAVAALSTSAAALTASSAPAALQAAPTSPTLMQGADAPHSFAKLVARAKPDGKASPDGEKAERAAKTKVPADAEDSEESELPTAQASSEGDAAAKPAEKPADLLAEIEAMVAAAGQLGVAAPAAAPVATAASMGSPDTAPAVTETQAPAAPNAVPGRLAALATNLPAANTSPTLQPVEAEAAAAAPTQAAQAATHAQPGAGAGHVFEPVSDKQSEHGAAPRRSDVATLLGALKSALRNAEDKDDTPAADKTAIKAPNAATPGVPATPAHKLPSAAIALAEAALPQPETVDAAAAAAATAVVTPVPSAAAEDSDGEAPLAVVQAPAETPPAPKTGSAGAGEAKSATIVPLRDLPSIPGTSDPTSSPAGKPSAAADAPPQSAPDSAAPASAAATTSAHDIAPAAPVDAQPVPVTAGVSAPVPADASDGAQAGTSQADQSIDRHLDLARDNQWLDRLARDISQAANHQGHLKFQLNPEHLGALTVEIANSAAGTAIRMTADSDQARAIIADAQPRLIAEVRAQGLRVAESHVDLNQHGNGGSAFAQGQQRQSSEDHKPFARTQSVIRDDADDSAARDDGELYA